MTPNEAIEKIVHIAETYPCFYNGLPESNGELVGAFKEQAPDYTVLRDDLIEIFIMARDALLRNHNMRKENPTQANDNKALREALEKAKKAICHHAEHVCQSLSWENSDIQSNCGDVLCVRRDLCEAKTAINAALAKPPRQCDVGTADEQARRYHNFTGRYNPCSYKGYVKCAEDCPVHIKLTQEGHGELLCQLEWAQMPYEAE